MSEERDIRKYIVEFTLHNNSTGILNTPERLKIIENAIKKDPGSRVKKILDINEKSIKLEVHCENGTLRFFKMYFPKTLIAYDEFVELSIDKYGKRSLFTIKDDIV